MNRWPRYLIFFTLCIVLLTFGFASSSQREPTYRGQTLTYWLMKSCFEGDKDATAAVRQIGTNAVPSLTKWLLYERSKMKLRMLAASEKLPRKVQMSVFNIVSLVGDRHWNDRSDIAMYGFSLLGPEGQTAIPQLVCSLIVQQKPGTALKITRVLRYIGEESVPPLVNVMTNRANSKELRVNAIHWIHSTHLLTDFAVSNLVQCVYDRHPDVALEAAFALAESKTEPDVVIPFLINAVHIASPNQRRDAVDYMSEYGTAARLAVPTLLELTTDPSNSLRDSVTNALSNIAPEFLNQTTAASN